MVQAYKGLAHMEGSKGGKIRSGGELSMNTMVTVSETLFAQINTISEMTIPVVALSLQTFAFRIKPHLILFSISFLESPVLDSKSCRWTWGHFVLLLLR